MFGQFKNAEIDETAQSLDQRLPGLYAQLDEVGQDRDRDDSPRICELVEYYLEDIVLRGAWTGLAALSLTPHAFAPVAELPLLEVVSASHIRADLTLGLGKVVHDYKYGLSSFFGAPVRKNKSPINQQNTTKTTGVTGAFRGRPYRRGGGGRICALVS